MPKRNAELELLRRTYQQQVMASRPEDCPSEETLAGLVVGELADASRTRIAEHVVACRPCSETVRFLRSLHEEARTEKNARASRYTRLFLASAAVLLIGLGTYAVMRVSTAPGSDVLRSTPGRVVEPEDGALLTSPPPTLSWRAEPGATGYRVRLFAADGTLVWESRATATPSIAVPPDADVSAGRSYFWTVTVEGPVRRNELGPFTFEVR